MSGEILEEFASIFYPKSHAVIGTSAQVRKFGGRFLRALLSFGYVGKLYAMNPRESQVLGLETYHRVGDIPGTVDSASIAVPAQAVPGIVEECLTKGIKALAHFLGYHERRDAVLSQGSKRGLTADCTGRVDGFDKERGDIL